MVAAAAPEGSLIGRVEPATLAGPPALLTPRWGWRGWSISASSSGAAAAAAARRCSCAICQERSRRGGGCRGRGGSPRTEGRQGPARQPARGRRGCPQAARPSPPGRAALLRTSEAPRRTPKPPPAPGRDPVAGPGTPGAAPGHSQKAHRLGPAEQPPEPLRPRRRRRGVDHVNGLRSLSAAQVSGRGCAAGPRGCCGDAGRGRRAQRRPPRGPALQSLGHRCLWGSPRGCQGVGLAWSLAVVAPEDTSAGCSPEVAQGWGGPFPQGVNRDWLGGWLGRPRLRLRPLSRGPRGDPGCVCCFNVRDDVIT